MLAVVFARVDPLAGAFWLTLALYLTAVLLVVCVGPLAAWLAYEWPRVRSWWGRRTIAKLFRAGLLAVVLAGALSVVVKADDGEFIIPDWCVGNHPCRFCMDAGLPWYICVWLSVREGL